MLEERVMDPIMKSFVSLGLSGCGDLLRMTQVFVGCISYDCNDRGENAGSTRVTDFPRPND